MLHPPGDVNLVDVDLVVVALAVVDSPPGFPMTEGNPRGSSPRKKMERATRLELATTTLAR